MTVPPATIINGFEDKQVCKLLECTDLAQDYPPAVLDLPGGVTAQARRVCTEGYKDPAIHKAGTKEYVLSSALCRIVAK